MGTRNKFLLTALIFVAAAMWGSCQGNAQNGGASGKIVNLGADEYAQALEKQPDAQLVDVRTPGEYAGGHLKHAVNLNFNDDRFSEEIKKLDPSKPVYVYCLSGGRSGRAASMLRDMGFKEVYNLDGGILKWQSAGKAVEHGTETAATQGMSMAEFAHVAGSQHYVLVDFNAPWCVPCQKMMPVLQKIALERRDTLKLVSINADDNKQLLKDKGIDQIPYLELYENGRLVWKHQGALEEKELLEATKH